MSDKPEPLIPMENIEGISERSYRDDIVEPLDEDAVVEAVDKFVENGVEALSCCFVWSFKSPDHEQRVKEILGERHPDLHVSISSEVSPSMGEYERTATTVLNSYLKPATKQYLESLREGLTQYGFEGSILLMFAHGGLVSREDTIERPIGLIESGPVSGTMGSRFIGNHIDRENIVSTDMGGTTFKVGVIREDRIEYADEPMVGRHHYQFPKRDVHSIPIAGGSIVSIDDETNVPQIGPESAGSDPGPVCYGSGGQEPTITDVDLVKGYFNPEFFLGGDHEMAPEKAKRVFRQKVADPLGKEPVQAAADIYKLANSMIADLIRETTVEKGIDPRNFTLSAIGGAAGMHAASYARELDIPEVVVPHTASVHSAFGLLSTDVTHLYTDVETLHPPFDVDDINGIFEDLERTAEEKLRGEGFDTDQLQLNRSINMRYQRQVHEVLTPVEADGRLTEDDLEDVLDKFNELYEQRYGEGSVFKQGVTEMVEFRVRAVGNLSTPALHEESPTDSTVAGAQIGEKEMYFEAADGLAETPVYDFTDMSPGDGFDGPGVILTPVTTIVVNPGDRARMDRYRNVRLDIEGGSQ
jgi:N-methylhydantoinase A